eukprot:c16008_g1_i1 orf=1-174(-)
MDYTEDILGKHPNMKQVNLMWERVQNADELSQLHLGPTAQKNVNKFRFLMSLFSVQVT